MAEDFRGASWRRIASSTLRRSLGLRRGRAVIIETMPSSLDFAELLAAEARRSGIRPVIFYSPERALYETPGVARPSDAMAIARTEVAAAEVSDGYIVFAAGPEDLKRREMLPPAYRRALSRREFEWGQTLSRNSVPSVLLLAASATRSAADQYGVNLGTWQRESFRASLVDPVALRRAAGPIAKRLRRGRIVTISHSNGTHLQLRLLGRKPILDDGAVDARDLAQGRNWTTVPSGFLVVAVDEGAAEGQFVSNRPSRHRRGVIRGVTWTFRDGRLAQYEIKKGRTIFESSYRQAGRERSRPALISIGLNPAIRDFPFAEDQELGVVTLYIGCNDDLGGRTHGTYRDYVLLRGADVSVDDQPILRGGRLV